MSGIHISLTPAQIKKIRAGAAFVEISEAQAASIRGALNGKQGGRPKSADRCSCGAMTTARAAARGHVCK
jgi:hypothetical protein